MSNLSSRVRELRRLESVESMEQDMVPHCERLLRRLKFLNMELTLARSAERTLLRGLVSVSGSAESVVRSLLEVPGLFLLLLPLL